MFDRQVHTPSLFRSLVAITTGVYKKKDAKGFLSTAQKLEFSAGTQFFAVFRKFRNKIGNLSTWAFTRVYYRLKKKHGHY